MAKLYCDSDLKPILRKNLSQEQYEKVRSELKNVKKVDAIPIGFIEYFASKQDVVSMESIHNMVKSYSQIGKERGGCNDQESAENS